MGGLETYLQKTEHEEWKSLKNFLQLSSAGGGLLFFGATLGGAALAF